MTRRSYAGDVCIYYLSLPVLELDGDLLVAAEVRGDVDLAKGATPKLPSQLESPGYSDVHIG